MRSKFKGINKITGIMVVAALLGGSWLGWQTREWQGRNGIAVLGNLRSMTGQWFEMDGRDLTKNNLIRFHVIANSDSPEDQALKRKVRDAVIKDMAPLFSKVNNIEEARKIAKANLGRMKDVARRVVKNWGREYEVSAQLGSYRFPVKIYGDLVLPAGEYEAVRIVIGEGAGANWWCVMFPPLCFVDLSKGVAVKEVEDKAVPVSKIKEDKNRSHKASKEGRIEKREVRFKLLEIINPSDK